MARKSSRNETTSKRLTAVPPALKPAPAAADSAKPDVKVATVVPATATATAATATAAKAQPADSASTSALQAALKNLQSIEPNVRLTAIGQVRQLSDRSTLPALVKALGDGDADVAREATAALGAMGDASVVQPLIDVLKNADGFFHTVVRAAAAISLGQLGDRRAVEPLLDTIADPSAEASAESIRALATLGDARAVDALIAVVRNPGGYYLPIARRAAVLALAKIGGDKAITQLGVVATDSWEDPTIRNIALAATQKGIAVHNP